MAEEGRTRRGANAPFESMGLDESPIDDILVERRTEDLESDDEFGLILRMGYDPVALENAIHTEKADPKLLDFIDLKASFGENARNLLDPDHAASKEWPHLSRNLRARLQAVFEQRGGQDFSLCTCQVRPDIDYVSHDPEFQDTRGTKFERLTTLVGDSQMTGAILMLCPDLQERIRIYGVLGQGTFGIAFLAREWDTSEPVTDPEQYAIKAQPHQTVIIEFLEWQEKLSYPDMVSFIEPTGKEHYLPQEAVALIYLNNSDRFPSLDSVYTHGMQWAMVMEACIDDFPESKADIPDQDVFLQRRRQSKTLKYVLPEFPPFSGKYLVDGKTHEIQVGEQEACKISGQLLQAMVQMADMGTWHSDLSVHNYLVDQDLNVKLIDLGQIYFSATADGFQSKISPLIPFQEYQMRPELALELMKYDERQMVDNSPDRPRHDPKEVYLPHDARQSCLWRYSAIVYGLLHGYWPWERRDICEDWHGKYTGRYLDRNYNRIKNRRKRMINEDITTHENLSQDCQDLLQAALSRNPEDRPNIQEMASFPWYSSWSAEEAESGRPLKRPRVSSYIEAQKGKGRKKP
ncbi:unnamed protein product [Penicillium olsonii]|nr:unnamed protein product [Penicillium olsonii]CAG7929307.1 unnamed protein product [Penicillium olsonii]